MGKKKSSGNVEFSYPVKRKLRYNISSVFIFSVWLTFGW
jgi:hypothetical protein